MLRENSFAVAAQQSRNETPPLPPHEKQEEVSDINQLRRKNYMKNDCFSTPTFNASLSLFDHIIMYNRCKCDQCSEPSYAQWVCFSFIGQELKRESTKNENFSI